MAGAVNRRGSEPQGCARGRWGFLPRIESGIQGQADLFRGSLTARRPRANHPIDGFQKTVQAVDSGDEDVLRAATLQPGSGGWVSNTTIDSTDTLARAE